MAHLIERQQFDICFDSAQTALEEQQTLDGFVRRYLQPVVEEVFDEISPEDEPISIERLRVELGSVGYANYRETLPERLREGLREALRAAVSERRHSEKAAPMSPTPSELGLLMGFLHSGRLGWQADASDPDLIVRLVNRAIQRDSGMFARRLRDSAAPAIVARRLASTLDRESLARVLRMLAGSRALPALERVESIYGYWLQTGMPAARKRVWAARLWQPLLLHALNRPAAGIDTNGAVTQALNEVAAATANPREPLPAGEDSASGAGGRSRESDSPRNPALTEDIRERRAERLGELFDRLPVPAETVAVDAGPPRAEWDADIMDSRSLIRDWLEQVLTAHRFAEFENHLQLLADRYRSILIATVIGSGRSAYFRDQLDGYAGGSLAMRIMDLIAGGHTSWVRLLRDDPGRVFPSMKNAGDGPATASSVIRRASLDALLLDCARGFSVAGFVQALLQRTALNTGLAAQELAADLQRILPHNLQQVPESARTEFESGLRAVVNLPASTPGEQAALHREVINRNRLRQSIRARLGRHPDSIDTVRPLGRELRRLAESSPVVFADLLQELRWRREEDPGASLQTADLKALCDALLGEIGAPPGTEARVWRTHLHSAEPVCGSERAYLLLLMQSLLDPAPADARSLRLLQAFFARRLAAPGTAEDSFEAIPAVAERPSAFRAPVPPMQVVQDYLDVRPAALRPALYHALTGKKAALALAALLRPESLASLIDWLDEGQPGSSAVQNLQSAVRLPAEPLSIDDRRLILLQDYLAGSPYLQASDRLLLAREISRRLRQRPVKLALVLRHSLADTRACERLAALLPLEEVVDLASWLGDVARMLPVVDFLADVEMILLQARPRDRESLRIRLGGHWLAGAVLGTPVDLTAWLPAAPVSRAPIRDPVSGAGGADSAGGIPDRRLLVERFSRYLAVRDPHQYDLSIPEISALQRLLGARSRLLADGIRSSLRDSASAARLVALFGEPMLFDLVQWLRPDCLPGLLRCSEILVPAAFAAVGSESAGSVHSLRWEFMIGYALVDERVYGDPQCVTAFVEFVAARKPAIRVDTLCRRMRQQLLDSGLIERNRAAAEIADRLATESGRSAPPGSADGGSTPQQRVHASRSLQETVAGPEEAGELENIYIHNAGLVLAAPYIPVMFKRLQLIEGDRFVDRRAAERGIHLLQYMTDGRCDAPEYQLVLNKVLCGVSSGVPLVPAIEITQQEHELIHGLLGAIIEHWKMVGNTSVEGLQESFLQREGRLVLKSGQWNLLVQSRPFDMLLDGLPWSYSTLRYPWMERVIHVEWR